MVTLLLIGYAVLIIYVFANKKFIVNKFDSEIKLAVNGNVSYGDIKINFFQNFPNVSVVIHKVMITDSMFAQHQHPFFKSGKVVIQIGIPALIKKELAINKVKISNGSFYLFTDSNGYSNSYLEQLKKPGSQKNDANKMQLESGILENVNFIVANEKNKSNYDVYAKKLQLSFDVKDESLNISTVAQLFIHGIAFYEPDGVFLKEKTLEGKFAFQYNKLLQEILADSISVKIDGHPFKLSLQLALKKDAPEFDLKMETKNISYSSIKSLLSPKLSSALSVVNLDSKIDAEARARSAADGGKPLITARWNVKNAKLTTPFFKFNKATFSASYSSEGDTNKTENDSKRKIEITNFSTD